MFVYTHLYSFNKYLLQTHTFEICMYMVRIFKVQAGFLIISHLASSREVGICCDPLCKCVLQKSTIKIQYEFEECPSVFICGKCNDSLILPEYSVNPCYKEPPLHDEEAWDFHFLFRGFAVGALTWLTGQTIRIPPQTTEPTSTRPENRRQSRPARVQILPCPLLESDLGQTA